MRTIEVSVDVFARIWALRLPEETSENQILERFLRIGTPIEKEPKGKPRSVDDANAGRTPISEPYRARPVSKKWTDVLIWTLEELGGTASLDQIYRKSREGRTSLGVNITTNHDASARECLESHSKDSKKYRGKADLFCMPSGKGQGVWALRQKRHPTLTG